MQTFKLASFVTVMLFGALVYAAPPTPNPDARTIPSGSNITINVLANDSDPDGDQLTVTAVNQPRSGAVTLNSDGSIFYAADTGVAGQVVRFFYTVEDENGEVAQSTVVITLVERNFSDLTQNTNDSNLAQTLGSLCASLRSQSDAVLGASGTQLLQKCNRLETLSANNPNALANALSQIAPEETSSQMRVAADSSRTQSRVVNHRVQQQKIALNGSGTNLSNSRGFALNDRHWVAAEGYGGSAGADLPEIWSRLGLFASVQIGDAERERSALENGYDASASGFTIGGDYFLSQNLLLGATISQSQNTVDYRNGDGELDNRLTTLGFFGAYYYNDLTAYVQWSHGWMRFDSLRRIRYGAGDFLEEERVTGETVGTQQALNTRVDYAWQRKAFNLTPFLRVDALSSQIDGYGEQGGGGLAMVLGEQTLDQISVALGVQGTYAVKLNWGVFMPTLSMTYQSETESNRDPFAGRFAVDRDEDRTYLLSNDGGDTSFYELAIGASAVFKHGISGFFEYAQVLDYDYLSASQIQAGVRIEL